MNKFNPFITALFLVFSITVWGQVPTEQDCLGAIPVCQNQYYQQNSYSGTGNYPNEISQGSGCPGNCLASGEKNDVWYIFTVQTPGNLSFTITPNNLSDDYDWAVYNLTNATCSDIYSNIGLQVSCNFTATSGATGPNGGSTSNCTGASGSPFNASIPVQAGETYVINISNWSTSQYGYTLDFSSSTASIFDNIPPEIDSVHQPVPCGASSLTFNFTEKILCNTMSVADLVLTGPGGPYTITNVTGAACVAGGDQENIFTIDVTPPITSSGTYYLILDANSAGSVTDLCGNVAPTDTLQFQIINVSTTISNVNDEICGQANGSATVNATGGTPGYTYEWSTTPAQTTATATNLPAGSFTVTVTDQGGCFAVDTVNILSIGGPTASIIAVTPEVSGLSNGSATVDATGGTLPYTYAWNTTPPQTTPTASNLPTGNYIVTVTDANGCSDTAMVFIPEIDSLAVTIFFSDAYCGLNNGSAVAVPAGTGSNFTFNWSNGSNSSQINNLSPGTYTVTVSNGTSTLTTSVSIENKGNTTASFSTQPETASILEPIINFFNQSTGASSYLWTFGDGTTSVDQNPSHSYTAVGDYIVTLITTSPEGCTDSTSKKVIIRDLVTVYIPNSFSPNGDGINDYFHPYGITLNTDVYEMAIFDRWGHLVFYTQNVNEFWDGSIRYKDRKEDKGLGVYSYKIRVKEIDGPERKFIGKIVLIP